MPPTRAEGPDLSSGSGLVLSERRPSYYLLDDRDALAVLTDKHLSHFARPALSIRRCATRRSTPSCPSAPSRRRSAAALLCAAKSTQEVRNRLVGLLNLPDLYASTAST